MYMGNHASPHHTKKIRKEQEGFSWGETAAATLFFLLFLIGALIALDSRGVQRDTMTSQFGIESYIHEISSTYADRMCKADDVEGYHLKRCVVDITF